MLCATVCASIVYLFVSVFLFIPLHALYGHAERKEVDCRMNMNKIKKRKILKASVYLVLYVDVAQQHPVAVSQTPIYNHLYLCLILLCCISG